MKSSNLDNIFISKPVEKIDEKYETLLSRGIDSQFAFKLKDMFIKLGATIKEITNQKLDIEDANQKFLILNTKGSQKTLLLTIQASNDDVELKLVA